MPAREPPRPGAGERRHEPASGAGARAGSFRPQAPPIRNGSIARLARAGGGSPGGPLLRHESTGPVVTFPRQVQLLTVSRPGDPMEREAEAVAAKVSSGTGTGLGAGAGAGVGVGAGAGAGVGTVGRAAGAGTAGGATGGELAGGELRAGADVDRLIAAPGAGVPLDPGVRARIEPVLAADLGAARVHRGPEVGAAAAQLQARAFTVGADIFLADGESPSDLALMAHEATHVVQQQAVTVYRGLVQREFSLSGMAMDAVQEAAQEIPGYSTLAQLTGKDPITGAQVSVGRESFLQTLLEYGPFAGAIGPVLSGLDVLDDIFTLIENRLGEHNLTFARIERDLGAAWDEVDLLEGIDYNVAIVTRYVDALLTDVVAFVRAIADDVLAAVRAAAVDVAEPLLQTPQVKPYWELAVKVFHHDPLRDVDVDAPTVEILADFLRLIGKEAALAQMQERGTLAGTAAWLDTQFARFTELLDRARQLFADGWAAISPENLPSLFTTLDDLADRAFTLIKDVGAFAGEVAAEVLALIKRSLLGWLADHADQVPGFHLLTVILGRNPFTGDAVERSAENLIRGFITLLPGGAAMYAELAQSGVIAEAGGRIEGELARLKITWELVTETFTAIWDGLSLEDLLAPIPAFDRITDQFADPLDRIIDFIGTVIGVVVELILKLMNFPSELLGKIVANAMAALEDIQADPIGFLKNVVAAMKAGFEGFFSRVLDYLLTGLTDWLFRGLRALGVEPPASVSMESIITLVIGVLGVSVETLWTKLGQKIGPERVAQMRGAMDQLGEAWAFIKDVTERGISAIWEFISGQLGNLWDTILQAATDWIMSEIVEKVTAKLLSMLDPTGIMAIINGTIAFFKAIQSALEYLREILQIVDGYVSTLASVARGEVAAGAAMLEKGLASAIPVAIGFLANQVGLSNVPEKIKEIIEGLRQLIEEALDWLFDQALRLGQAALSALGLGGEDESQEEDADEDASTDLDAKPQSVTIDEPVELQGQPHEIRSDAATGHLALHSDPIPLSLIPDQTGQMAALALQYEQARNEYEAVLANWTPDAPRSYRSDLNKKREALEQKVRDVVARVGSLGLTGIPGASAPNIGMKGRHGQQPQRIRPAQGTEPMWAAESEHILPFGTMKHVWTAMGDITPGRGGSEDNEQTTIVIYYGAARKKTPADNELTDDAAESAAQVRPEFKDLVQMVLDSIEGGDRAGAQDRRHRLGLAVERFKKSLGGLSDEAVKRTVAAITLENQEHSDDAPIGKQLTNGERRGGEPPIPTESAVRAAAEEQLCDIRAMITEAYDYCDEMLDTDIDSLQSLFAYLRS